jgi:hypothetical protein
MLLILFAVVNANYKLIFTYTGTNGRANAVILRKRYLLTVRGK